MSQFDGFLWLVATLFPLLFIQPWLHREIQVLFLLLTRRADIATILFALLFFPGVLLHEASHFLMAKALFVPTGRFSLLPRQMKNGMLQLGYVETAKVDWLREFLIGLAPLLAGGAVVAYAGVARLGLSALWGPLAAGDGPALLAALAALPAQPDFVLWFYLTATVSATMMPSASDRRTWLPLGLILAGAIAILLYLGGGQWLAAAVGPRLNDALRRVAVVFGIAAVVQTALLLPLAVLRRVASEVTGLEVK
ncbi:MAG: hypothetical protein EPO32_12755 [Anaerolineae bacterium]|nr:MAG: hypothetical protein EPO32_12755 [Anaerolineae bacterium]